MKKPVNIKDEFLEENKIVFGKFIPLKKIDNGAFGNIYKVRRIKDNEYFAMKTEKKDAPQQTLKSEANSLLNFQRGFGFPQFIGFGQTKQFNVLIETLLGKSLYNLFVKNKNKCNIIDVCLIGNQILDRLEWIHSKDYIYRDIKPENFLIGIKDPNVIYIVDFGLCKKYRSPKTGKHISPKSTGKFNGTLIYASPYVVRGEESSRRDDLISLGYMLIYLFKRELPWESSFKNLDQSKYFELIHLKETDGRKELFKNIPKEFINYIKYTRQLKFEENPNYPYLHSLFNNVLSKINTNYKNLTFSWIHFQSKGPIGTPKTLKNNCPQYKSNKNIYKERKLKLKGLQTCDISNNEYTIDNKTPSNNRNNIEKNMKNIINVNSERTKLTNNNNEINSDNLISKGLVLNNNINNSNIFFEKVVLNNNIINVKGIKPLATLKQKNYCNSEKHLKVRLNRSCLNKSNINNTNTNNQMNNINKNGLMTERNKKIINNILLNKNNPNIYINLKNNERKYLINRKPESKIPIDNFYINKGNNYKNENNHENMKIIQKNNRDNTINNLSNYITYQSPLKNFNNIKNSIFSSLINIKRNKSRNNSKHYICIKNKKIHNLQELNDSIVNDDQLKNPSNNYSNIVSFKTNNNLSYIQKRNDILKDNLNNNKTLE